MSEACWTGGESVTETGAGGTGPQSARTVQAPSPGLLVFTLALTALSAPHMTLLLGAALLLQVLGTPALALLLVLHLEDGALLVTLPSPHRTLAHHHRDLADPSSEGHAGTRAVTASTASPDHHVARAQLVDVRVVGPRHGNHLGIIW